MRSNNTIRNTLFALVSQVFTQMLNFINRTLFIHFLGTSYLGVSGLFSNILSVLSLAELGVGSAIIYTMYKPIAEKDENKVKQLIHLFSKSYKIIGIVVLLAGLSILPFLDILVKDKDNIDNLTIIYLIYLTNTVFTYFWAHKRSLITADQKEYINTINQQIFSVVQVIIDFFVLILTHNFLLYISTKVVVNFFSNLNISLKVNKLYPFLKTIPTSKLPKADKKEILKNIKAMMYHKIGGVLVFSTDNILISIYFGVVYVGMYSNYALLTSTIVTIASLFFNASTASVGNLNATQSSDYSFNVYKKMFFLNFVIYVVVTVCIFNLIDDFIVLWVGEKFILNRDVVIVIITNFFLMNLRTVTILFKDTMGLFYQDRFRPLLTAFTNLFFSIILLKIFGLIGVFLGTLICIVGITIWFEPYILFKYGFKRPLKEYFAIYIKYLLTFAVCIIITYPLCKVFINITWVNWLLKAFISVVIPMIVIFVFYKNTEEYKFCVNFFLRILKQKKVIKSNLSH